MEKKKLLFVIEDLYIGGAEKSLVTLFSCLDYSKYEVDLLLFSKKGDFLAFVPDSVTVLPAADEYKILCQSPLKLLLDLCQQRKFKLIYFHLMYLFHLIIYHFIFKEEYIGWKYTKKFFKRIDKHYDVAIGFLEKKSIYFTVDRINASKKIGYIHNNYLKIEHDKKLDDYYFNYLNSIVTVSEHCLEVLQRSFLQYYSKFIMIKNFLSPDVINTMANEKVEDIDMNISYIKIVTVARLVAQKGIDNAILICDKLVKENPNIRWYVIGEGAEKENLEKLIQIKGLENKINLLGSRKNPYKYMKMADIYVQPSRYEGYGITIAEAKVLCKPIVASNIPEFQEQIISLENGWLCDNNEIMAEAILTLINDNKLKEKFTNKLRSYKNINNKAELMQFYHMIE